MMKQPHGFTFFETMIALVLVPLVFLALTGAFGSSRSLASTSRTSLRAHEDLRANLEAVANVVRGVDIDTLSGFDGNGMSAQPTFQRVVGADEQGPVYTTVEQLRWRPLDDDVDGIDNPGEVVHDANGQSVVVARRVPLGGFHVEQLGNSLEIHLTTYYATDRATVARVTAKTAVSLRN